MKKVLLAVVAVISFHSLANAVVIIEKERIPANSACTPIVNRCLADGFKDGQAKIGNGLYKDCVDVWVTGGHVPQLHPTPFMRDKKAACRAERGL